MNQEQIGMQNQTFLHFWKGNEFWYPELATMAHDVLSITVSTVALESIFSVRGQVINQFRNALKPDVVEALVCSKDWLYANIGNVFFIYMLAE